MSISESNNKRIAKNTIMLYIRTFVIMFVSLYTSRVILETLGETDFGIYNIVGGFIALLSFIKSALTVSTQRFLNVELGKNNEIGAAKVYSISLVIHIILAIGIYIILETIGLYFFENKMNIPVESKDAARWVYHFSALTACILLFRIPNDASIIAYEKMSFYAYVSIIEAILKLSVVYLLLFVNTKRLELYAFLILFTTLIINTVYSVYCHKKIQFCRFRIIWDKATLRNLFGFSGWSLLGGVANVAGTHGVNILLNIFFSVTVNAAMGIANQVYAAIYVFVNNFQTAINPQIIKFYAAGEKEQYLKLVFRSSKFSFFLLFVLAYPLMLCCNLIMDVWLVEVPKHTVSFVRLCLVYLMIDAISSSLWISAQAIGNIKKYQIIVSCILLLNIPIIYVLLKLGFSPESAVVIRIIMNFVAHCFRLVYLKNKINFPVKKYIKNVMLRCAVVSGLIIPIPLLCLLGFKITMLGYWTAVISSLILSIPIIYYVGLEQGERKFILNVIKKYSK